MRLYIINSNLLELKFSIMYKLYDEPVKEDQTRR